MIMPGGLVSMSVNERGVTVCAQEVVGCRWVKVHQVLGLSVFFTFRIFALLTQCGRYRFALLKRFGEEGCTPFRTTHLGPESLIVHVISALEITVGEDKLPSR